VNCMTEYYLQSVEELHQLEPLMRKLEEDGLWKMLSREIERNTVSDKSGCFHIFKKL